jgi:hypothetical protein
VYTWFVRLLVSHIGDPPPIISARDVRRSVVVWSCGRAARRGCAERYRRIARRCGKKGAIVVIGRSILVIVWHLLSDLQAGFHDLGPDFFKPRPPT